MSDGGGERRSGRKNQIAEEYWVAVKGGKRHPTWPGVLVALHENGLLGIEVQVLQYPSQENGHQAVCQATVTMAGSDGRELVYTEIGDASPLNVGPQIAPHALRMAATRAKGRAGRDALALGIALAEELYEGEPPRAAPPRARHDPQDQPAAAMESCEWPDCPELVAAGQARLSRERFHRCLCAGHEGQLAAVRAKKEAKKESAGIAAPA
jgi:hypothetical protein